MPTYHSQLQQDFLLDRIVFRGMRGGVFVDVGANDGVTFSNSLMFERDRGWTGLCVEPNPDTFAKLKTARAAQCLNIGISDKAGSFPFTRITGALSGFSGFTGAPQERLQQRINGELAESGVADVIQVEARPLGDVLRAANISEVHYLSIDTQGEEPLILRSLQGAPALIHVIDVECNYRADRAKLVEAAGPDFAPVILHRFELYLINRKSQFLSRLWPLRFAVANWEWHHRLWRLRPSHRMPWA